MQNRSVNLTEAFGVPGPQCKCCPVQDFRGLGWCSGMSLRTASWGEGGDGVFPAEACCWMSCCFLAVLWEPGTRLPGLCCSHCSPFFAVGTRDVFEMHCKCMTTTTPKAEIFTLDCWSFAFLFPRFLKSVRKTWSAFPVPWNVFVLELPSGMKHSTRFVQLPLHIWLLPSHLKTRAWGRRVVNCYWFISDALCSSAATSCGGCKQHLSILVLIRKSKTPPHVGVMVSIC